MRKSIANECHRDVFGPNQGKHKENPDRSEGDNGKYKLINMIRGAKLLMKVIEIL